MPGRCQGRITAGPRRGRDGARAGRGGARSVPGQGQGGAGAGPGRGQGGIRAAQGPREKQDINENDVKASPEISRIKIELKAVNLYM